MQQDYIINRQSSIVRYLSSALYICREPSTNHPFLCKTNPIQTQSKLVLSAVEWANFQKAKMNVNLTLTKDYRKKDDFAVRKNKPNFVKGQK